MSLTESPFENTAISGTINAAAKTSLKAELDKLKALVSGWAARGGFPDGNRQDPEQKMLIDAEIDGLKTRIDNAAAS